MLTIQAKELIPNDVVQLGILKYPITKVWSTNEGNCPRVMALHSAFKPFPDGVLVFAPSDIIMIER